MDPKPATHSLMIGTPLYDGAQAHYLRSAISLAAEAERRGLPFTFALVSHNPSISRARNIIIGMFLQSDCTHLLFVDGDIGFNAGQALDLIRITNEHEECAIIGAAYPLRSVNWHNVAAAAEKGLARGDPKQLEKFAGIFAMEQLDPKAGFRMDQPVELAKLGTGLMLIRRDVVETLCKRLPELSYRPNDRDRRNGNLGEELFALFQPMIEPETRHLLSDDYAFCRRVRDVGFRIWMAPWMRTSHTGPAHFDGSIADLLPLYVSKTSTEKLN